MIYLDNASTTKLDPAVLEAMMPYLTEQYGNAGTLYALGRSAKAAVDKARQQVAGFINAKPEEIIFTSGGTEANNAVYKNLWGFLDHAKKTHIIFAHNHHVSEVSAAENLCIKQRFHYTAVNPNSRGVVEAFDIENALQDDTGLVSVMYMNNETGSINPVREIGAMCAARGILFHTDCVQAAGCCEIDVEAIKCTTLSMSSHKIHGPKGVGALYIRDKTILSPIMNGGSTQEFGLRGGTENVAGIVGFGAACELMGQKLHEIDAHNSALKQVFYNQLVQSLTELSFDDILHVNGDLVFKHGKILNLRFDGVDGETLVLLLDAKGVCVSAGSACNAHESVPSHVLLSMGISPEDARNSIRVSFSKFNTEQEVISAARTMATCVALLKR